MKKQDWLVILIVVVVLAPFFIPATGFFAWFEASTKAHPFIMAFFKFAILATFGEMLALRIREGVYNKKGFGIVPRMMVWGFLGMCIAMAMIIFKSGVPAFLGVIGGCNCPAEVFAAPELTWGKVGVAFAVSVLMNTIFAPVMMTFHKCTDIHILENGGTVRGLLRPMHMRLTGMYSGTWCSRRLSRSSGSPPTPSPSSCPPPSRYSLPPYWVSRWDSF